MKLTLKSAERAVRKLCAPAYVYFILSAISIALLAVQNFGQNSMYCVGHIVQCIKRNDGIREQNRIRSFRRGYLTNFAKQIH